MYIHIPTNYMYFVYNIISTFLLRYFLISANFAHTNYYFAVYLVCKHIAFLLLRHKIALPYVLFIFMGARAISIVILALFSVSFELFWKINFNFSYAMFCVHKMSQETVLHVISMKIRRIGAIRKWYTSGIAPYIDY